MSEDGLFDGFMPMIDEVILSKSTSMINTNGELVNAHSIKIKTRDGLESFYSIESENLMRLFFLIMKSLD